MFILYFDTETNGLPTDRKALTRDVEKWPRVIQIAWQLWEYGESDERKCISSASYIITPSHDIVWNAESEAIHKISKARAMKEGVSQNHALEQFKYAASMAHVLVAHNLAFDKSVVRAEYYRMNTTEEFTWWPPAEYCTMEYTKMLCKLPSKYTKPHDPYKNPRLGELYSFLYGKVADVEFHNAAGDVECLVQAFHALVERRWVPIETWLRNFRVRPRLPVGAAKA
jgi:DNA polymerase III epsilon subunit-like protein